VIEQVARIFHCRKAVQGSKCQETQDDMSTIKKGGYGISFSLRLPLILQLAFTRPAVCVTACTFPSTFVCLPVLFPLSMWTPFASHFFSK
jgi:hypothetical protein